MAHNTDISSYVKPPARGRGKNTNRDMITETTYSESELEHGKCTSCDETSDEIVWWDGRCVDCIEEEKFYIASMYNRSTQGKTLTK